MREGKLWKAGAIGVVGVGTFFLTLAAFENSWTAFVTSGFLMGLTDDRVSRSLGRPYEMAKKRSEEAEFFLETVLGGERELRDYAIFVDKGEKG